MGKDTKFAEFLRKRRSVAGLRQADIQKKLGYGSPQFVSNWERGVSMPPHSALPVLAKLLGVAPSEIKEAFISSAVAEHKAKIEKNLERFI